MFLETKNLDEKKVFDLVSDDFRYAKALEEQVRSGACGLKLHEDW